MPKRNRQSTADSAADNFRRSVIPGQAAADLLKGVLSKVNKATKKDK